MFFPNTFVNNTSHIMKKWWTKAIILYILHWRWL